MSNSLRIQLLGSLSVSLDEEPVRAFRTAKTRALLAYIAMEADREHSRTSLATLLWGELPDAAAKTNLRIELSNLKSVLASHPALEIGRNHVRFHSQLAATDALTFGQNIAAFHALSAEAKGSQLRLLADAVDLYHGEFLAGFHLNDAIDFEDWELITREQLHEQMMHALNALQGGYAEQARWSELAAAARRQLALVPWTESAHRNLMQALAAQGEPQAALAQFDKCRAVLLDELGVEPSRPTLELAARLRGDGGTLVAQHNLAQSAKSFVGRKEEVAQLQGLVAANQIVTVLGIGGVGKSHLAQRVAHSLLHDFAGGVWFVPLANVEADDAAPERVALAIAAAIGFQVADMQKPLAELAAHLAPKQALLILDNWEHLVEAAPVVLDALLHDSAIHILATSRVRLMIEGERTFQLEGLSQPEAFNLFIERARRMVPSFAQGEDALPDAKTGLGADILKICAHVAGLPLGIELAASWVEHYSVAEIGQSIGAVAVQPQHADGLLHRHHRLSGVFEVSWQLLGPRQQQILARLSLFRGGFDRAAVAVVAESSLNDLSMLIAHSLVQRVMAGRYGLHPLIQEFAATKVDAMEVEQLNANYAKHYLSTLVATPPTAWKAQLTGDFENIRSAWQRAVQGRDVTIIRKALVHFGDYLRQFALLVDANALLADAAAAFEAAGGEAAGGEAGREQGELVALLLDQQSNFVRGLAGLKAASVLHLRVLELTDTPKLRLQSHMELANYFAEIGEWEQADAHFARSEIVAQESDDLLSYIEAVELSVHVNAIHFRGDFAAGITRLEELLRLIDTIEAEPGDSSSLSVARTRARTLQSLTLMAIRYGDYALALRYARQSMQIAEATANRQRTVHLLVDISLAEQFAGLYADAIKHIEEALTLAHEIGDTDEKALLKANLCLTMRQAGAWEEALAHGLEAIPLLTVLGNKRIEGQARNRVGHCLLALGRWDEADAMYGDALAVWDTMQHPNRFEAVAGRALAAVQLGQREQASTLVDEVLAFVAGKRLMGIVEPAQMLLNCESVLIALGRNEEAYETLQKAGEWVETIADRISDDAVREAYLCKRPDTQQVRARLLQAKTARIG